MTYYKIINGQRYDRSLLEAAEQFTKGRGEWQISLDEIQQIYAQAADALKFTEIEWQTLRYIGENFPLTQPAKKWLQERFDAPDEIKNFDQLMHRIVRMEFGFKQLQWQITATEASNYNKNPFTVVTFQIALRQALRAFLERGFNTLSLQSVVRNRVLGLENEADIQKTVRERMEGGGILYLVPDGVNRENFPYDLPAFLNLDGFYYIGLHIPAFSPVLFMAQGTRTTQSSFFHIGYISQRPALQDVIFAVVRQLSQFSNLIWEIDPTEVEQQMKIRRGQNFGEALYAVLTVGIFNGESSFSFRDFILQDVWVDPERSLDYYMRDYIESGVLTLLSPTSGVSDFNIPQNFIPDFDYFWVFGLTMPRRTDARFIITAQREGNLDASWNDGFLPENLTFEQQIQRAMGDEFHFPRIEVKATEAEFEAQRTQFGPDYRTFSSLLRQTLNTMLNDYRTPNSLFYIVSQVHADEVQADHFDDPQEYRAAIRFLIYEKYLSGAGILEFLPIELPDNNPPNGESIEQFWQFYGYLPALSDIGFWVIIPRFPDDDQLPYCYGFN
jgi:hypothetical protein